MCAGQSRKGGSSFVTRKVNIFSPAGPVKCCSPLRLVSRHSAQRRSPSQVGFSGIDGMYQDRHTSILSHGSHTHTHTHTHTLTHRLVLDLEVDFFCPSALDSLKVVMP